MALKPGRLVAGFIIVSFLLAIGPLTSPYWIAYFGLCPAIHEESHASFGPLPFGGGSGGRSSQIVFDTAKSQASRNARLWAKKLRLKHQINKQKQEEVSKFPRSGTLGNVSTRLAAKKRVPQKKIYSITVKNNITSVLNMNYTFPRSSDDETTSLSPWSLFMNIYTSENLTIAYNASFILREQLFQLGRSYATTKGPVILYYNTIHRPFNHTWMETTCQEANPNLSCRHLKHFEEAQEDVTLSAVHEYCQQYPKHSVIYLHPKGCFHPADDQDQWRRSMTAAVSTKQCIESTLRSNSSQGQQCDLCGLLLQPLPEIHYPGNMFAASCSYIEKLHAPAAFHEIRQTKHVEWHNEAIRNHTIMYSLFRDDFAMVGVGRFEWEHWVGSHPDLKGCDVSPTNKLRYWTMDRPHNLDYKDSEFVLQEGPRFPYNHDDWEYYQYWLTKRKDLDSPHKRIKSYYLLRGVIDRYWLYYDKVPDTNSSWIWEWFPDGKVWKEAVISHGRGALYRVLPQYPEPTVFPYSWQQVRDTWAQRKDGIQWTRQKRQALLSQRKQHLQGKTDQGKG